MIDLVLGYVVMSLIAAGAFFGMSRLARSLSARACDVLAVAVVAVLFVYIHTMWHDVRLAQLLPVSCLVVVGNWLPLFAAALAGLAWQRMRGAALRQWLLAAELTLVGAFASAYPLLGKVPRCEDRWDRLGTCLQTTEYTCSAAAAATLLRKHGIEASEQEMAELCLTRSGTSWQGLYRGLKRKTAGTAWDVEVCRLSPSQLFSQRSAPAILSVGLDSSYSANTDYTREFGWVPGVNHSVVLERFSLGGAVVIADPSIEMCREQWDAETLETLWRGHVLRLVPRRGCNSPRE